MVFEWKNKQSIIVRGIPEGGWANAVAARCEEVEDSATHEERHERLIEYLWAR